METIWEHKLRTPDNWFKKPEQTEQKRRIQMTFSQNYAFWFTNILYYFSLAPFRFKMTSTINLQANQVNLEWKTHTNVVQKLVCIFTHTVITLTVFIFVSYSLDSERGIPTKSNSLFYAAIVITGTFLVFYVSISIWFYEPRFRLLLDFNESNCYNYRSNDKIPILHKFQNISAIICVIVSVVDPFIEIFYVQNMYKWTESVLWASIVRVLVCIYALVSHFPDVLFRGLSFTFRDKASQFAAMVASSEEEAVIPARLIWEEYFNLYNYVQNLNDKFGIWILTYAVLFIPFYSLKLNDLLQGNLSVLKGVFNVSYFVGTSIFLIMSANSSLQVSQLNDN